MVVFIKNIYLYIYFFNKNVHAKYIYIYIFHSEKREGGGFTKFYLSKLILVRIA